MPKTDRRRPVRHRPGGSYEAVLETLSAAGTPVPTKTLARDLHYAEGHLRDLLSGMVAEGQVERVQLASRGAMTLVGWTCVITLLPNVYRPTDGGTAAIDQDCPRCEAIKGERCWDLRKTGRPGPALRPHLERRIWRGDAPVA